MSLKDAVNALRSLKAELEATRAAKGELENAYREVLEELRIAQGVQQYKASTDDDHGPNEDDPGGDQPPRDPGKSRIASGSTVFKDENAALEAESRSLREELVAVKARAEESAASAAQQLQEAVAARDEAVRASESARAAVEAAEVQMAKEMERAQAAERELQGAVDDAALLRTRLNDTCKELDSARDALATTKAAGETSHSREEGQDAAELESELKSIREAVAAAAQPLSFPGASERKAVACKAAAVAALTDAASRAVESANKLQSELAAASRDDLETREPKESTTPQGERDTTSQVLEPEAEDEEALGGARKCLASAEGAAKEVRYETVRVKEGGDDSASALAAALEEAAGALYSLGSALFAKTAALDETRRLAASGEAKRAEEASSLRRELASVGEELNTATRAMASATAESHARAEADRVAAAAAAAALEQERAATAEASARIAALETVLREAEADRKSHLAAAAAAAVERRDAEVEAAAGVAKELLAGKEAAEDEARRADTRASTAEAAVSRLKSKVAELKEGLTQSEQAARAAVEGREAAEAARAEADERRQGVEDTLLVANKELQRLRLKSEEALSESEGLREDCNRLTAEVETLRAAAASATVAADEKSEKAAAALSESEDLREECNRLTATVETLRTAVAAAATAANKKVTTGAQAGEAGANADGGEGEEQEVMEQDAQEEFGRLRENTEDMERVRDEAGQGEGEGEGGGGGSGLSGRGGGEEEEGEGRDGDEAAGSRREIIEERDRLRAELAEERRKAAVRVSGLETQLADKEREAADTQRRLYLRQSELETELDDLNAHHDALRLELARMDASIQDAADASLPSSSPLSGSGAASGSSATTAAAARSSRSGKDPSVIGAEVGGAVGGILRGRFWSGWGGGGGEVEAKDGGFRESGGRQEVLNDPSRWSKTTRGGFADGVGKDYAGGGASQQNIDRVRHNVMARLQDAASHPVVPRDGGESGGGRGGGGGESARQGDALKDEKDVSSNGGEGRGTAGVGVSGAGETGQAGAAALLAEDEWVEETVEHPAPDYGVDSPVIRYLLQQWSSEPEKLRYLSLWLRCVIERRKVPDAFPSGLQLVGLAPEIKDGFLTLVIPMIRFNGGVPVMVHSRRSPPHEGQPAGGRTRRTAADDDENGSGGGEPVLWDLRVKVDLSGPSVGGTNAHPGSNGGPVEENEAASGGQKGGRGEGGAALAGRVEHRLWAMQEGGGAAATAAAAAAPGRREEGQPSASSGKI